MSFQSWWQQKNRRAKAVAVLATLLILQIGLCFGTPVGVSWLGDLVGTRPGRDPFYALGYMFIEAILAIVVFLVFVGVLIFYRPATRGKTPSIASPKNQGIRGRDERDK